MDKVWNETFAILGLSCAALLFLVLFNWYCEVYWNRFHREKRSRIWEGKLWSTDNSTMLCKSSDGKQSLWETAEGRYFIVSPPATESEDPECLNPISQDQAEQFIAERYPADEAAVHIELVFGKKVQRA